MSKDLFRASAPLRKAFGVEPFYNALAPSVNADGEAFLHELCHVVSLENSGVRVKLASAWKKNAYTSQALSELVNNALDEMTPEARYENECETLAIELLLLESNGFVDIREKPEKLGVFLRPIWSSQPASLRRYFKRSFKKFVLRILELRDDPRTREAAPKVVQRAQYWRNKCSPPTRKNG